MSRGLGDSRVGWATEYVGERQSRGWATEYVGGSRVGWATEEVAWAGRQSRGLGDRVQVRTARINGQKEVTAKTKSAGEKEETFFLTHTQYTCRCHITSRVRNLASVS